MNSRIHLLPPLLANQIAAGEVVERPASIVKELLENALDAKARRIQIDLENGGLDLIRIRDDGTGIIKEDLPLAVTRHATSKISKLPDLYCIKSMGFRGEALASIASIARLSMQSRYQEANDAWQIKIEDRDLSTEITPASHPIGTTIEVRNIFYNTPARKKFLRSSRTEYLYIEEIVKKLALSRFDIGFTLIHNQKQIFNLRALEEPSQYKQRLQQLFSREFSDHAYHFNISDHNFKCWGWFGSEQITRSQTDQQFFYVNGRIIRDKVINHALKQAYQAHFPEGRHPSYLIYFELPHQDVDVNVHPTKHEVRFKESRLVHDFLVATISDVLNNHESIPPTHSIKQQQYTAYSPSTYTQPSLASAVQEASVTYDVFTMPKPAEFSSTKTYRPEQSPKINLRFHSLFGKYTLVQLEQDWWLIDTIAWQQARLKQKISEHLAKTTLLKAQPLLIPSIIEIEATQQMKLENWKPLFDELLIELLPFAPNKLVIRELPTCLQMIDWQKFCTHLINEKEITQSILLKHIYTHLIIEKNLPSLQEQISQHFATFAWQEADFVRQVDEKLLQKIF